MVEPSRTYRGETAEKRQCARCGKWSKMQLDADSRSVEKEEVSGGVLISDRATPPDLDPPLLPTTYRCPECAHVHPGPPPGDSPHSLS